MCSWQIALHFRKGRFLSCKKAAKDWLLCRLFFVCFSEIRIPGRAGMAYGAGRLLKMLQVDSCMPQRGRFAICLARKGFFVQKD